MQADLYEACHTVSVTGVFFDLKIIIFFSKFDIACHLIKYRKLYRTGNTSHQALKTGHIRLKKCKIFNKWRIFGSNLTLRNHLHQQLHHDKKELKTQPLYSHYATAAWNAYWGASYVKLENWHYRIFFQSLVGTLG